jgi:hypothetical protein
MTERSLGETYVHHHNSPCGAAGNTSYPHREHCLAHLVLQSAVRADGPVQFLASVGVALTNQHYRQCPDKVLHPEEP